MIIMLQGCADAGGEVQGSLTCGGRWTCSHELHPPFDTDAEELADGSCLMGTVVLRPDGTLAPDHDPLASWPGAWWSSSDAAVRVCFDDGSCMQCDPGEPSLQAGDGGGDAPAGYSCTGWPTSCSSRRPGSCSSIRGCRLHNRVRWDGSLEPECTGYPDRCGEMPNREYCLRQGCEWGSG